MGCVSKTPTWSQATVSERLTGQFIMDDKFMVSAQFTNDINESANTIIRLIKQKSINYEQDQEIY